LSNSPLTAGGLARLAVVIFALLALWFAVYWATRLG
jgi:hypothetical protein